MIPEPTADPRGHKVDRETLLRVFDHMISPEGIAEACKLNQEAREWYRDFINKQFERLGYHGPI